MTKHTGHRQVKFYRGIPSCRRHLNVYTVTPPDGRQSNVETGTLAAFKWPRRQPPNQPVSYPGRQALVHPSRLPPLFNLAEMEDAMPPSISSTFTVRLGQAIERSAGQTYIQTERDWTNLIQYYTYLCCIRQGITFVEMVIQT